MNRRGKTATTRLGRGANPLSWIAFVLVFVFALALFAGAAPAQDEKPTIPPTTLPIPPPGTSEDEPDAAKTDDDSPPSLDELLGIESESEDERKIGEAERVADLEAEAELQRRLEEEMIGNAFAEAIKKMEIVANLLDRSFDTGLGTQRVQEEVLSKLQLLLESAKKKQSSGGSSSGSSSGSRASPPKPKPGKEGGQGAKQGPRSDDPAANSTNADPPSPRDGEMNTVFEEARSEWGSLPQRVRDMLLQGRKEKFSSLYEQLTREYYRRLAEEGSP